MNKKVMLIIRDGRGYSEKKEGNAIYAAKTPNDDKYNKDYPNCLLECSGNAVGNPKGVQGGSEVGHLTIGAGRIVWQPYELINRQIKDGSFLNNLELTKAIHHCKIYDTDLHIGGLLSDQGIHADYRHMHAVLELCKQEKFDRVYIHVTTDGRDVPEKSALEFIEETEKIIKKIGIGKIVSVVGRYYSMDRDRNRERTIETYQLMTQGKGFKAKSAKDAVKLAYKRGEKTDYYIKPTIILDKDEKPIGLLEKGDAMVWYNFRADRSRQISSMIARLPDCEIEPDKQVKDIYYVCFSSYDSDWELPVAFPQLQVENNLGEVISNNGLKQLRIAETEKYAHVTFFFNSQKDQSNKGESRVLINSPKVKSYDMQPEMSAYKITKKLLSEVGNYDLIVVNYANPDLVGHSGKFDAVVKACEVVDECVGEIVEKGIKENYSILLMADHGNAENMLYLNGEINPSHGTNPVRMTLINADGVKLKDGGMSDIAPTILELMGVEKPEEMTGQSLVIGH
ncbi:MAG TPA: 2,3-bisphosphoglycerate-independent phosphoglycerate mutase [Candidatus Absconditabacterales bacterium]|nr:2,3-bisphosphoglycerate-independent phosphoglycerate mutase [Candidatus Absconditabacterales bacterium]